MLCSGSLCAIGGMRDDYKAVQGSAQEALKRNKIYNAEVGFPALGVKQVCQLLDILAQVSGRRGTSLNLMG